MTDEVTRILDYKLSRFPGCIDVYIIPMPDGTDKVIKVYPNAVIDKADYELLKKHGHLKEGGPKFVV